MPSWWTIERACAAAIRARNDTPAIHGTIHRATVERDTPRVVDFRGMCVTDDNEAGKKRPGGAERPHESGAAEPVPPLPRGEDLETVSGLLGVAAATLTAWRDAFLAAGEAALATRPESAGPRLQFHGTGSLSTRSR
ncbi:MAG: hypothetical protein P4L90_25470 [Rhodopila sp.]|nr:hypothetical protein [Rhodopila sp.]